MPLYLDECMVQTSPLGILVSILCYSVPALVWRLMYGKENIEFHEETAVSFWFGKGRLTILSLTIVFNLARLVYECISHNVFAILVAVRILAGTYQLYDHYWMQRNWIEYFVHGKKRAFLWIRFYASAVLLLLYATLDEVQIGIVGHYGEWFHQYVITTFFYSALLACFLFWFLWFLLSSKSDNRSCWGRAWSIDRSRFLKYRFYCLRNITISLIPFFILIGVVANIIGDNVSDDLFDNTMQWRYPFMLAGDLSLIICLISYLVYLFDLTFLIIHVPRFADADGLGDSKVSCAPLRSSNHSPRRHPPRKHRANGGRFPGGRQRRQ